VERQAGWVLYAVLAMGRGNHVGRKGVILIGLPVGRQEDRIFVIKSN
jgi:hypothetical protein